MPVDPVIGNWSPPKVLRIDSVGVAGVARLYYDATGRLELSYHDE
jgi:hypothetical protein